jgi:hypothetical protein
MGLQNVGCGDVYWIELAHDVDMWRVLVNVVMNFRVLYVFFWVFPRRQIKFCRRFGTLCQVHLQRLDEEYEW